MFSNLQIKFSKLQQWCFDPFFLQSSSREIWFAYANFPDKTPNLLESSPPVRLRELSRQQNNIFSFSSLPSYLSFQVFSTSNMIKKTLQNTSKTQLK
ncbi:hypothetical protein QL285_061988 [Trifolium repens]|nr:hypothetical protein QL285_061988 [Trifolium repens]